MSAISAEETNVLLIATAFGVGREDNLTATGAKGVSEPGGDAVPMEA